MANSGPALASDNIEVTVLTADSEFEQLAHATFGANAQIDLRIVRGGILADNAVDQIDGTTIAIIDLDASREEEFIALHRLLLGGGTPPPTVVVVQQFNESVARRLVQMQVADFLVKPVTAVELVKTCARVARSPSRAEMKEAQIYTFLPAAGGVGVTTLAIQAAFTLLNSAPKGSVTTCLVDLDFQHGACADYLDLEPRLDISEIEPKPERLDRQLFEVMLSHHPTGLAVVAAPNRPAEMRSFDPNVVTRLLDLVASYFDYVVIDMPRTWFSWTDNLLLGSNRVFIVTEMTVPGLRHAKQLVAAISERLGPGPRPQVIVNRFEQRLFATGLRRKDIQQALGNSFAGTVANDYRLVREAIDRGIPLDEVKRGNSVSSDLRKLILPQTSKGAAPEVKEKVLSLFGAR